MRSLLVVIGGSAGGLTALREILPHLEARVDASYVVVLHRDNESEGLVDILDGEAGLPVVEAEDKAPVESGRVHVAPPGYHLLIDDARFALSVDPPIRWSRPSIDALFESAADAYGAAVVGVVLSGANEDGARGLRRIVDCGGRAVVQDPDTADSKRMPAAALAEVSDAVVLPLERIGGHVAALGSVSHRARG